MTKSSTQEQDLKESKASYVIGIIAIISIVILPGVAIVAGILAIILGASSLQSDGRKKAKTGIIMGIVAIILQVLIYSTLFLFALPYMQSSQRNTQRKDEISVLAAEISSYQSKNGGQMPNADELSADDLTYIASVVNDGEPDTDTALYAIGVGCDGSQIAAQDYSLSVLLENNKVYCQES